MLWKHYSAICWHCIRTIASFRCKIMLYLNKRNLFTDSLCLPDSLCLKVGIFGTSYYAAQVTKMLCSFYTCNIITHFINSSDHRMPNREKILVLGKQHNCFQFFSAMRRNLRMKLVWFLKTLVRNIIIWLHTYFSVIAWKWLITK